MLTYQVRQRSYRHSPGKPLTFPNTCEVAFLFRPLQPFGKEAGGGRTAVQGGPGTVLFDANTGRHWIESKEPLNELEVIVEAPTQHVELRGNQLRIRSRFETVEHLDQLVEYVCFGFPILLNVEFADPPVVERVAGTVGGVPFRGEFVDQNIEFLTTTQELQEQRAACSWDRFKIVSKPGNRRVLGALHYFHVACRLVRAGNTPWEFMSEALLNLSKVLEVLFPSPAGDGKTLNAAREGLGELGYSEVEIERDFIPAMALRSGIDSAHVFLAVFTRRQLRTLQAYTEVAESAFREMLRRLFARMESGEYSPAQYGKPTAKPEAVSIIKRMARHFG